ncbi:MAG TPA: thiamine pyrophosphate-dependent dehydrogenase E1 component subunit alpha [Acidiphilium sp.]
MDLPISDAPPAPSADEAGTALRLMLLIRGFEEAAEAAYMRGTIHGTMHLSIGQEATAVGICLGLRPTDLITSTHRGHGHCIAKGADVALMFAELSGKEAGYCRGRGGSMHIADIGSGNLGANGIVGGGIAIATGAALALRQQKRDDLVVCFFGDGASNEGVFHEALNMAALWKLPVVFVCENNKYGMSVSTERSMAVPDVAGRAAAYGMASARVDGNDVRAVRAAAFTAFARARAGAGPSLIEAETYRIRGHSRSDRNRYRTREEIDLWKSRDPIARFERHCLDEGLLDAERIDALRAAAVAEIEAAIGFADAAPSPDPATLAANVYAEAPEAA